MNLIKETEKYLCEVINSLGYSIDKVNLVPSGRRELGQFQINEAFSLAKINFNCQNGTLPCDYWDKRAKEWSYTVSAYMALVKQVLSKDFDYIDDLAEELSQFYSDLIRGYGEASKKTQEGSNTSAAREYFCCALRMMEDLMDYIYCVIGLPID